jgi:dephospho-CoA kinase
LIIGISGKIHCGKSLVAKHIVDNYGYRYLSTSDLLKSILSSNNREISRENLQDIGNSLISNIGGSGFMAIMFFSYPPDGKYLIDSIRHLDALKYMRLKYGDDFKNIFIKSNAKKRFLRKEKLYKNFEQFNKIDNEKTEIEINSIENLSDYVIFNESTVPDLIAQTEEFMMKITSKYKNT